MNIIFFGAGGHAASVGRVATDLGHKIVGSVDPQKRGSYFRGVKVVEHLLDFPLDDVEAVFIAVGDAKVRFKIFNEIKDMNFQAKFPNLIHPSAEIASDARIGQGNVFMPLSHVGPDTSWENFGILNTGASVEHGSNIGSFVNISPGVITGGNIQIGDFAKIGIGSTILENIDVGAHAVLGAHSMLNKNLGDYQTAYGTPATVRSGEIADSKVGD